MRAVLSVVLGLLAVGCRLPEIDLEGRLCPCVAGYTCVDGVCVTEAPQNPLDAGEDRDGGTVLADGGTMLADGGTMLADGGTMLADGGTMPRDASMEAGSPPGETGVDSGLPFAPGEPFALCTEPPGSVCVSSADRLCDGFETWGDDWLVGGSAGASVLPQNESAFSGLQGLLVETTMSGSATAQRYINGFTNYDRNGELWIRFWMRVETAPSLGGDVDVLAVRDLIGNEIGAFRYMAPDGQLALRFNSTGLLRDHLVTDDCWRCIELQLLAGPTGYMALFVNGHRTGIQAGFGDFGPIDAGEIELGLSSSPAAARFHFDDLVISGSRPGCY